MVNGERQNLVDFAKYWSNKTKTGPTVNIDEALQSAESIYSSATVDKIYRRLKQEQKADTFYLLHNNKASIDFWFQIAHLWQFGAMGGVISLNWNAVSAKITLYQQCNMITLTPELLEKIEIIEMAALPFLNKND